jgi:hypothetical protein
MDLNLLLVWILAAALLWAVVYMVVSTGTAMNRTVNMVYKLTLHFMFGFDRHFECDDDLDGCVDTGWEKGDT